MNLLIVIPIIVGNHHVAVPNDCFNSRLQPRTMYKSGTTRTLLQLILIMNFSKIFGQTRNELKIWQETAYVTFNRMDDRKKCSRCS